VSEAELTERWSTWYVVRGVGAAMFAAILLRLAMPELSAVIGAVPQATLVGLGQGTLAALLTAGDWGARFASVVSGAVVVIGVAVNLLGGLRREYRATPGCLTIRRSTFSGTRRVDVDSITGVDVRSGLVARLFHGGSLRVRTKAGTVRLRSVEDPQRWADALRARG
jgi:uncharacterized membrane protein YdbT with pleckstrin-like domain